MPNPETAVDDIDLSTIETMTDEELDALANSLGLGDGEAEGTEDSESEGDGATSPEVEDGSQAAPKSEGTGVKLTGDELLKELQASPEAQKLISQQLQQWVSQASAEADAKRENAEFAKLVESGDFEAIGRRFVTDKAEREIRTKAEDEALTKAYGEVYHGLFEELKSITLSETEKMSIDPSKFRTDAELVLAMSSLIASKKVDSDINNRIEAGVKERLETLKNMKSAQRVNGGSPGGVPGGVGGTAGTGKETSRSLIQEGFQEILESAANNRVDV